MNVSARPRVSGNTLPAMTNSLGAGDKPHKCIRLTPQKGAPTPNPPLNLPSPPPLPPPQDRGVTSASNCSLSVASQIYIFCDFFLVLLFTLIQ